MERYLTILEVSQKQAYIFSSNKLRDNITNSNVIAWITGTDFIEKVINDKTMFNDKSNLVYQGGGHTILQFNDERTAKDVTSKVTGQIIDTYPDIEVFAKTVKYDEKLTPGENIRHLTTELEKKKAVRKQSFHQGTFGIEKTDVNTLNAKRVCPKGDTVPESFNAERFPEGYKATYEFGNLGGSYGESNFIAVVHIDGNGMGKRVEEFSAKHTKWEDYCSAMQSFSSGIAKDFRDAYEDMKRSVAKSIASQDGKLADTLDLRMAGRENIYFPLRRIILEGDDVCFVSEGRIGIEAAVRFIEHLNKKRNAADNEGYNACAGVAIVHRNYPFYRAYELAEVLCSNAKKFGASLSRGDNGASVSSIDWHIEYGEIKDTLEETRKEYAAADGKTLELRPYIINAPDEVLKKEPIRKYANFKRLIIKIMKNDSFSHGVLKELRGVLKKGETAVSHYMKFYGIENIGRDFFYDGIFSETRYDNIKIGDKKESESVVFIETADGKERSVLFDAIELMETYLELEEC